MNRWIFQLIRKYFNLIFTGENSDIFFIFLHAFKLFLASFLKKKV